MPKNGLSGLAAQGSQIKFTDKIIPGCVQLCRIQILLVSNSWQVEQAVVLVADGWAVVSNVDRVLDG